jgi:HEAT repeat protein
MRGAVLACLLSLLALPAAAQPNVVRPFEDVVRELESREPQVRVEAMRALARAGHPDAIGPIARLLADPLDDIQVEALDTLLQFYLTDLPRSTRRVAGILEVGRRSRAEAAFEQGPFVLLPRLAPDDLRRGLAAAIKDDQPKIRREAIWTLGALVPPPAGPEAEAALGQALRDPDPSIRLAAARVAGAVRASSLGDLLVSAMNDPSEAVQYAAMRALGDLSERRAERALRERFTFHARGPGARAALDGLARIAEAASLSTFQDALAAPDPELRRLAFEGLARLADVDAIRAIEATTAGEKDRQVRLARAFALARAGRGGVDDLAAALEQDRYADLAMAYLVELGQPAVPALAQHLRSPERAVRGRIAQVLGLVGGPDAIAALDPTRRDMDADVARAAEHALLRIRLLAR